MAGQIPDLSKIFEVAKKVASQIEPPEGLKDSKNMTEEDMSKMLSQITSSVSKVMTPEMVASVTGQNTIDNEKFTSAKKRGKQKALPLVESKITFDKCEPVEEVPVKKEKKNKRIVEIESDDSESDDSDSISKRTKDMTFTLAVTLEELYTGTKKKLGIRRQKIEPDGSYQDEKKKLSIKIEPGMIDEQTIRFNKMADEKQGYETGDVVVSLDVEEHPEFIRDGNNLLIEKEISVSEAFKPVLYVSHLNGKTYRITGEKLDIFSDEDDLLKKIPGLGMPVMGEKNEYGDLFIRFKVVNSVKITPEIITTLTEIFPPLNTVPENLDVSEIQEKEFEMVTESDLEFFESDDDDSDSEDYSEYSDSEESD
jgi:hypothetical protein